VYHILKQRLQLVEASTLVSDGNGTLQVPVSEILSSFCNVAVDSSVSFSHDVTWRMTFKMIQQLPFPFHWQITHDENEYIF